MKKLTICPNCGSKNIIYAGTKANPLAAIAGTTSQNYFCKDCGYEGPIILEALEKDERRIAEETPKLKDVGLEKGVIKSNTGILGLSLALALFIPFISLPLFFYFHIFMDFTSSATLSSILTIIVLFFLLKFYLLPKARRK